MKKSKLLLTLLMAGLMATSVVGLAACDCGGDTGDNTQTEQPDNGDEGETPGGGEEGGEGETPGGGDEGGEGETPGGGDEGGEGETPGGGDEGGEGETPGGGEEGGEEGGGEVTPPPAPVTPAYTLETVGGNVEVTVATDTGCEAFLTLSGFAADDYIVTVTGATADVIVSFVDGDDIATLAATLSDANEYTATISAAANQKLKLATAGVNATFTVTVVAAPDPEPAPEEPVITMSTEQRTFDIGLGETFTLPNAVVTDNIDTEIAYLEISVRGLTAELQGSGVNKADGTITGGTFSSKMLGSHVVEYVAVDSDDNESVVEITINVTSDTYTETADVTGYNTLDNLTAEGGTFKENFEKGAQSPLIKGAAAGEWTIEAGANALNGNSMIMDYGALAGLENRVFLNTIPLMTGKWSISFDVKLIKGAGFDDFYVGFVKEGTVSSTDQQKTLSGMAVGDVRRITWESSVILDEAGSYYVHFFRLDKNYSGECVMAFDNFEFTYTPPALELTTTTPTLDELKVGYTYDWTNTYMPIGGAEVMPIADITDGEAAAAIASLEGFTDNVQHLTGSGPHDLTTLTKSNIPDMFQTGWTYYIEVWYYAKAHGSPYLIAYDGSSANHTVSSDIFPIAKNYIKIPYTVAAADNALTFYATGSNMDVYIGSIKITGEAPAEVREDYHVVTNAEMLADGGYTYDWSTNNVLNFSSNVAYMKVVNLSNPALVTALNNTGAYTTGYAMRYQGSSTALANSLPTLIPGNTYTVTVKGYDMGGLGNLLLLTMASSGGQIGSAASFNWAQDSTGLYTGVATFTPINGAANLNFYGQGNVEAYFASINIKMTEPAATPDPEPEPSSVPLYGSNLINSQGVVTVNSSYASKTGVYDNQTSQYNLSGDARVAVYVWTHVPVTVTYYYYIEESNNMVLYANDGGSDFQSMSNAVGWHEYTFTFAGPSYLCLYTSSGTGTLYLCSLSVVY